jgi:FlaA1/EpsC-like NDP-sugar epimerase
MLSVNILNTIKTFKLARDHGAKKYFCVSTDKAANPVNMMGASKRIMEMFLMRESETMTLSMARFANVAFSDGSLLYGFNKRIEKKQPIVAPNDIKRYFVIPKEAGELCLMSCIFGENRDIFFPKLTANLNLITFSEIAVRYLRAKGLKPFICKTEEEARELAKTENIGKWPCLFTTSDTTGEKDFEEFFTDKEVLDMKLFRNLGVIKNELSFDSKKLDIFEKEISTMKASKRWNKLQIVNLFHKMIPDFEHKETGKYLDSKM